MTDLLTLRKPANIYRQAVTEPRYESQSDPKRTRACEIEFSAGGQRLGSEFLLDDGSLVFVHESEITPETESLMTSLGAPTEGLRHGDHNPGRCTSGGAEPPGWGVRSCLECFSD